MASGDNSENNSKLLSPPNYHRHEAARRGGCTQPGQRSRSQQRYFVERVNTQSTMIWKARAVPTRVNADNIIAQRVRENYNPTERQKGAKTPVATQQHQIPATNRPIPPSGNARAFRGGVWGGVHESVKAWLLQERKKLPAERRENSFRKGSAKTSEDIRNYCTPATNTATYHRRNHVRAGTFNASEKG